MLLVCLGLTLYFGLHALVGKHGFEARSSLLSRAAALEKELGALDAVRSRLERETALLSEATPDADYVEEIARSLLGYAKPGDLVLLEHAPQRSAALER